MRVTALLFSLALILFSFGTAMGQDQGVYMHHVDGLNGTGGIDEGATVTFYFGFNNSSDYAVWVVSHGIVLYTYDPVTWTSFTSAANPAYKWDLNFGFPCFFDLGFYYQQYFSADGMGADTLGIGGGKGNFGTGLPIGFNDWAVSLTIGPVSGNGTLTLDSTFYPPAGYWMWGTSGGIILDCAWPGPFEYVVGNPGEPPVIAEILDQAGTVGVEFYYDVEATGIPAPVFSLAAGYPAGMTINPGTGEITWTPTAAGAYPVTVVATNDSGEDTEDFTITVEPAPEAPTITTIPVLTGKVGDLYTYDVDATGYPVPTIALTSGPAGMTMDAFGVITWTPGVAGDFDVIVTASNGVTPDAVQEFTISVEPADEAPTFITTPILDGTVGVLYTCDFDATGYPEPTISLTSGPTGMAMDANGVITWTPDAAGDFPVIVLATNGVAPDAEMNFTITVLPAPDAPAITTTPAPNGKVGVLYTYDVDATGYPEPTIALTSGPAGMVMDAFGVITWTPAVAGDFDVVVTASNGVAPDAVQEFTISVEPADEAPTITTTPVLSGVVGVLYTYDVDATGYPEPTIALTSGPAGMTMDAFGVITWTPGVAGDFDVIVTASNGVAPDAVQEFTISVEPAPEAPTITTTPVLTGKVGFLYTYDVDATGYPEPTIALTSGPAGMSMDAFGVITWTPGVAGDFDVVVTASNGVAPDAVQEFTISVEPADEAPTITTTPVLTGTVGVLYTYDVDATGYPEPTIALTSGPAGMAMDAFGVITWTPGVAGDFDVIVTASNGVAPDAVQEFTISVEPAPEAPVITTTPVLTGKVGFLYTYDVDATGYPEPTIALTSGPAGMTIDAFGVITWTPSVAGDYDVVVTASNGVAPDAVQEFTISVEPADAAPTITTTPVLTGVVGILYTYDVDATGYPEPTIALTSGPTGMTMDAFGVITWTPDAVGDYDVVVTASNGVAPDAVQEFTISVEPAPEAPTITTTPVLTGTVGVLYTYDVDAIGVPDPTIALASGPAGMTMDAFGVITWTPGVAGDFDVVVTASNGVAPDAVQEFTISVEPAPEAPTITTTPVLSGVVGVLYTYDVDATGYPEPTIALTSGPAGMTMDAFGVITWTPGVVGDYDVVVTASNGVAPDAVQEFTISVEPAPEAPAITTTPTLTGKVGFLYTYDVDATGYPEPTIALTSGPAGMTMDAFGVITWTPGVAGDFDVVVTASNGVAPDAVQEFTISVEPADAAPTITTTPVLTGVVDALYTYDVDATGYPEPTIALTAGPTGMAMDAFGVITWTPDAVGDYDVVVTASNGIAPDAVQEFTITVEPAPEAPVITTIDPPTDGQVGELYTYDFSATGYPEPTIALTSGPNGMAIDENGVLTWIPTVDGSFDVTVTASNGVAPDAVFSWTINVIPAYYAPVLDAIQSSFAMYLGDDFYLDVNADAFPAATYSLDAGYPAGMTIDPVTGEINWTPDAPATVMVTVRAENIIGSDSKSFTIEVIEFIPPSAYHWPNPIHLKDLGDRVLWIYIEHEQNELVDLSTVLVQGKVPPYLDGYPIIEDDKIVTNCFVFRFLSAYRPIPETVHDSFTVTYSYFDGTFHEVTGPADIEVPAADVTLDGYVNEEDANFMRDYLWRGGETSELEEMMDVNRDGRVDPTDLGAIMEAIQKQ